jgi:hypothetical protein
MANSEWLDGMLNPQIKKEAMESQGTDKQDHFERKVVAHDWIKGVSELDPAAVEAEYQAKLAAEAMHLTAAYDEHETPKETITKDYERDVKILSDYALAEMLAELRCSKEQNTQEMYSEAKEKAKKEVASSREKAEKALLELTPDHTMLDWQKAFDRFSKEAKPEEVKEKDLYKPEVPEKAHDFEHPTEEKFKLPTKEEMVPAGNGREADERKEVTEEAVPVVKEASQKGAPEAEKADEASIDKESATNQAAIDGFLSGQGGADSANLHIVQNKNGLMLVNYETPIAYRSADGELYLNADKYSPTTSKIQSAIKAAAKGQIKEVAATELEKIMQDKPVESPALATVSEKAPEAAVEKVAADGCPVCGGAGDDLKNGQKDNMSCKACGLTYACGSLTPKADLETDGIESPEEIADTFINGNISDAREWVGGDLDKFMSVMDILGFGSPEGQSFQRIMRKAAKLEIKLQASKADTLKKIAEIQSPWQVIKDAEGNEVIARVEAVTNMKESEDDSKKEIIKSADHTHAPAPKDEKLPVEKEIC